MIFFVIAHSSSVVKTARQTGLHCGILHRGKKNILYNNEGYHKYIYLFISKSLYVGQMTDKIYFKIQSTKQLKMKIIGVFFLKNARFYLDTLIIEHKFAVC